MKMRRIAAAMAAVSMLTVISAQSVFAADAVTLTAGTATVKAGENFTVNVDLAGVPASGINGAEFEIAYDASALTITGVTAGSIVNTEATAKEGFEGVTVFDADFTSNAGTITVTYGTALEDASYWVTQEGTFLTITGTVKADAKENTYPIKLQGISRETFEGSGVQNTDIYIGNMAADNTVTSAAVTAVNGAVVVSNGETTPTESQTDEIVWGDADENGKINVVDVVTVNKAILNVQPLSDKGLKNADINQNGKPDSSDALNIMKLALNLLKPEDCPIK